ncbi:hypothetical protein EON65_35825 [archaeon]|nr:MAG: hypothetical protein EON65_35825 [archaeon]
MSICQVDLTHAGHQIPVAFPHPPLLPQSHNEEDTTDYLIQFKIYHIDSSKDVLKGFKGFRKYVQDMCRSLGLHGYIWRIPNVHARILATGTRGQLHGLLDFLKNMQESELIGFFEVERPERGVFSTDFHVRPSESRFVETGEYSDQDMDDVVTTTSEHADVAILKGL